MSAARTVRAAAGGFSLVEVMVAVVVICVGLLGIAKLQSLAMSNTSVARNRSLAAMQAASFASAMHSNREYWASFAGGLTATVSGVAGAYAVASSDGALQADTAADFPLVLPPNMGPCVVTVIQVAAACTAEQLAAFDLARWWELSLAPMLPGPAQATISCPPPPLGNPAPPACTIVIQWTEKTVSLNSQEAANETGAAYGSSLFEQPIYTLYVEP
ncbi:MAG TPA: prepilin-type N-terminal cleavage/methylation domain-containing protein [Steroidobacteraceae bacterium]|jgi:type IV pilus assembly protein PilV|nr:prepilin-type N-terminal cleavage/methylation domain-containing protein [Steroidobacteraceae bacterium]